MQPHLIIAACAGRSKPDLQLRCGDNQRAAPIYHNGRCWCRTNAVYMTPACASHLYISARMWLHITSMRVVIVLTLHTLKVIARLKEGSMHSKTLIKQLLPVLPCMHAYGT